MSDADTAYLLSSVLWAASWFVVGFAVGWALRAHRRGDRSHKEQR